MDLVDELVGASTAMAAVRDEIRALLAKEGRLRRLPPVLITGETGTGKGLAASILHRASSRATAEFVSVNGAAIPEHLLESELFGYERGAFTDARHAKPGLLQTANHGTLFLDEVALLPLSLQAKLLKALEDQSVRRLGSTRSEPVDFWIIAATNEDLTASVRTGRFREDLYHRLAVLTLALPPLRNRAQDIELLAGQALVTTCSRYGVATKTLGPEALAALRAYRWPGNIRELNSVIERAVLASPGAVVSVEALRIDATTPHLRGDEAHGILRDEIADLERRRLSEALARSGWNISRTAATLGIARNTLRARIARYGLRAPGRLGAPSETREDPIETPRARGVPTGQGRPSVAVLPFRVEGDDETRSYFGDGIVDGIVGSLAALHELLVISRSSTLRYKGGEVDVRVVGQELGVTYAVSGSVRRAGPRIRVSVELAETSAGTVVWATSFDGVSDDPFALQDQIAARVVSTIAPQVREAELRRVLRKRPENLEAYDCTLRALAQIYQLNAAAFAEARTSLARAIELDPTYAMPYALLAIWHTIRVGQGWAPSSPAEQAEVLRLSTAAIERDSFDAMALALCGHAKSILRYEFDEAIALFDRALEASPNSAIAWARSSPTYSYIGEPREAIRRAEQALRLSPFDRHIFLSHAALVLAHYSAGQYDEAIRWGRKAREENPRYDATLRLLAASLGAAGQLDEAQDVARALVVAQPGFLVKRFVEAYAIRDPERQENLARHLRMAGLPG
jgi:transcriptional regulator with AAA-type ATPase domain/TolB-like protein